LDYKQKLCCDVLDRVPTVRESQGILSESGKVRENREGQGKVRENSGNFKIPLTRPIIYALFSQFLPASGGFAPRPPPGLRPQSLQVSLYCNIIQ